MLDDYLEFMKNLPASAWKVFCYYYDNAKKISGNDDRKKFKIFFHIDVENALITVGTTRPTFFKSIKLLEELNFLTIDRTLKKHNKYKINRVEEIKIPFNEISNEDEIYKTYENIENSMRLFGMTSFRKFTKKGVSQLKELKINVPLKNYLQWFIKTKVKSKKIIDFNMGIFSCNPMLDEYKKSFHFKKYQERGKLRHRKATTEFESNELKYELVVDITNKLNEKQKVSASEMGLIKESIIAGEIFLDNKKYSVLLEFENMDKLKCSTGIVNNKECSKCFMENHLGKKQNKIDCQLLNIDWEGMYIEIGQKKNKINENDKQIINYGLKINLLDRKDNSYIINKILLEKMKNKYRGLK